MKHFVISFGLLIIAVLALLWLAQVHQFHTDEVDDVWVAVFSVSFLIIGVFLIKRAAKKKTIIFEQKPSTINYGKLLKAGISRREGDVLALIDEGLSNQQIADKLFISESTVKKHISNLFHKLQVERRNESVKKAKEMSILL